MIEGPIERLIEDSEGVDGEGSRGLEEVRKGELMNGGGDVMGCDVPMLGSGGQTMTTSSSGQIQS